MSKWALIDVTWMSWRAKSVIQGMSFNGDPTGVIYGFLESLRTTCLDPHVLTNQVALCFDSKHSYRKNFFPAYKEKRKTDRTPEEWAEIKVMKEQIKRLRKEILPSCGFTCLHQYGLESDDVMAQAAGQITDAGMTGVMITSDGDLYQSITDAVHWYDPMRNLYLDPPAAWRKCGIPPNQWADVKAIAGCAGDEVPGVPGVGTKSAIDYILGLMKQGKRLDAIQSAEGNSIIIRNRTLVSLPFPVTQPVNLKPPTYNPRAFYEWAGRLGFSSLLDGTRRRAWDMFFAGDLERGRQVPRKRGESCNTHAAV